MWKFHKIYLNTLEWLNPWLSSPFRPVSDSRFLIALLFTFWQTTHPLQTCLVRVLKGDIHGSNNPSFNNPCITGLSPVRPSKGIGYCFCLMVSYFSRSFIFKELFSTPPCSLPLPRPWDLYLSHLSQLTHSLIL